LLAGLQPGAGTDDVSIGHERAQVHEVGALDDHADQPEHEGNERQRRGREPAARESDH
jgi:hypothetical protein